LRSASAGEPNVKGDRHFGRNAELSAGWGDFDEELGWHQFIWADAENTRVFFSTATRTGGGVIPTVGLLGAASFAFLAAGAVILQLTIGLTFTAT
jgi:hypothetical protein